MSRSTLLVTLLATALPATAAEGPSATLPAPSPEAAPSARVAPAAKIRIQATLELAKSKQGLPIVRMTAKNVGTVPVSFLDTPEGSFTGDHFWDIQVKLSDGQVLQSGIKYAVLAKTAVVRLRPGETHMRDFSIGAYVRAPSRLPTEKEEATVVVRYRTAHLFEYEEKMLAPPYVGFASEPLTITLRDHF